MLFGDDIKKIEKLAAKGNNEKLVPYLSSSKRDTRMAAIKAIDSSKCESAYNKLVAMMKSSDVEERIAVIDALVRSKNPGIATFMNLDLQKETDEKVIAALRNAIATIREQSAKK